jgi:hypothetical protein
MTDVSTPEKHEEIAPFFPLRAIGILSYGTLVSYTVEKWYHNHGILT